MIFSNKMEGRVGEKFMGCSGRSRDSAGEIEGSVFWLTLVNAWQVTVVRCLN